MSSITNPLVNSYKRLVPGYEAPVYIAWSVTNRSPLIRIPSTHTGSVRIELRSPDPSANPYLALAVCLRAGLQGIVDQTMPPKCIEGNIFEMSAGEREENHIEELPGTLIEAIHDMENDSLIKDVLGDHAYGKYIDAKKEEWHRYRSQVTEWEINEYLNNY